MILPRWRRGILVDHEGEHARNDEPAREDDEPAGEAVRPLLHEPNHVGSEEPAQVAE